MLASSDSSSRSRLSPPAHPDGEPVWAFEHHGLIVSARDVQESALFGLTFALENDGRSIIPPFDIHLYKPLQPITYILLPGNSVVLQFSDTYDVSVWSANGRIANSRNDEDRVYDVFRKLVLRTEETGDFSFPVMEKLYKHVTAFTVEACAAVVGEGAFIALTAYKASTIPSSP